MNKTDSLSPVEAVAEAVARLNRAIDQVKPIAVFGLFSGGHDSLSACYVASQAKQFDGCAHFNTGIGIPETRRFVRETCAERGWVLREWKAMENQRADGTPDPQDYRELVRKHGFPGPHGHGMMYQRLKQRGIQWLVRTLKRERGGNNRSFVILVSGCRSQESVRRMGNVEELQKDGARYWSAPIHDWSKLDTGRVIAHAGLRRNPVVDLIHKSGECLCGAFAVVGELSELALWFPAVAREIRELQAEVEPRFGWGWEGRPPKRQKPHGTDPQMQFLCHNCNVMALPTWATSTQPTDELAAAISDGRSDGSAEGNQQWIYENLK